MESRIRRGFGFIFFFCLRLRKPLLLLARRPPVSNAIQSLSLDVARAGQGGSRRVEGLSTKPPHVRVRPEL